MEFETIFKIILSGVAAVGLPLGIYVAFRAAMATVKDMEVQAERKAAPQESDERLMQLEQRVAELEERLDFAERVLGQHEELRRLESGRE